MVSKKKKQEEKNQQQQQPPMAAWERAFYAIMPYLYGLGDVAIFLFEYLFITTIAQAIMPFLLSFFRYTTPTTFEKCCAHVSNFAESGPCISCLFMTDGSKMAISLTMVLVWCYAVCKYFLWRYKIELKRPQWKLTWTAKAVIALHLSGVAGMIIYQLKTNTWVYSMSNIMRKESLDIEYGMFWTFIIGAPLIEEIVLKVILITVIARRTRDIIFSIMAANLSFAALHLINAIQNSSQAYSYFQVAAAVILGLFFSTRYVLSQNLVESVSLHVLNNLPAVFIPITLTSDQLYAFMIPASISMLVYLVLIIRDLRDVKQLFDAPAEPTTAPVSIKQD